MRNRWTSRRGLPRRMDDTWHTQDPESWLVCLRAQSWWCLSVCTCEFTLNVQRPGLFSWHDHIRIVLDVEPRVTFFQACAGAVVAVARK